MSVKKMLPNTPGTRFRVYNDFSSITTSKPYKPLTCLRKKASGRNNTGRITSWNRGGSSKRYYRIIDFKREKMDVLGTIATIEYDPNRTSFISLVNYSDGSKQYILSPKDISVGDKVVSSKKDEITISAGNAAPVGNISSGTKIHCIELYPGKGAALSRSAGSYAYIINRIENTPYTVIRLSSGEIRKVLNTCMATIGEVSNGSHKLISLGKAGAARHRGRRPHVRGTAKNPVDHCLGGGNGKNRGRIGRSRWGQISNGLKTRRNKSTNKFILTRRGKR